VFPVLALAIAWLVDAQLRQRLPSATHRRALVITTVCVLVGTGTLDYVRRMAVDRARWNDDDVAALGAFARERGLDRGNVHLTLRGGLCGAALHGDRGQRLDELLLGGLRMHALADPPRSPAADLPAYFVLKLDDPETLPDGRPLPADAIILPADPAHPIALLPGCPMARLEAMRVCVRNDDDGVCMPVPPEPMALSQRRILPRHRAVELPGAPATAVYYELPLRWPATASAPGRSTFEIIGDARWQITGVAHAGDPARVDADFPSKRVELELAPGAEATLTIASDDPAAALGHLWWPPLIEWAPACQSSP
ncbi:MAG: hypothetical protein KC457_20795, partial [Myxococcales bacterium]|nr:hypothetical protein [Myxococcales bacterium]